MISIFMSNYIDFSNIVCFSNLFLLLQIAYQRCCVVLQNVLCFLCIPVLYCNIIHAYYAFFFLLQYLRWTGLSVHFKHYVSPASNFESLKAVSPEAEPETYTKWPEKYNDILNLMQSSTVSFVILAGLMVCLRSWRCSFLLCCFGLHHIKRCIPSAYLYQLQTNLKT